MMKLTSSELIRINMRYYRVINGFTQEQLAEKLNMTEKHYCHLENGKYNMTLENLDMISSIFKKEPWELLKENHSEDNIPSKVDKYTGKRNTRL